MVNYQTCQKKWGQWDADIVLDVRAHNLSEESAILGFVGNFSLTRPSNQHQGLGRDSKLDDSSIPYNIHPLGEQQPNIRII